MFDYIVRLLVWAVEGGAKVSLHPVYLMADENTKLIEIAGKKIPRKSFVFHSLAIYMYICYSLKPSHKNAIIILFAKMYLRKGLFSQRREFHSCSFHIFFKTWA